ncbi:MAG: hypothetical protein QXI16_01240 [Sulfolobaceae archaeon]
MNRLEMIYQDEDIEIYFKSDLLNQEYYLANSKKVLARYYSNNISHMIIEARKIKFKHLNIFHEVVITHKIKSL